jgi:hypothetical protein
MSRRAVTCAWALFVAATAAADSGRLRSPAIYPPQVLPLTFDHAAHLKAGADCTTCHDAARKSTQASDLLLPAGSAGSHPDCEPCHDIDAASRGEAKADDPPSRCGTCHTGFDETVMKAPAPVRFPNPHILFSHKAHVDEKIQCQACHGKMTDVSLATVAQLPKMETCLVCHDNTFAAADCKTCHVTAPSGRLQINFTSGLLRPMQGNPYGMDHGPRYEFNHGTRAKLDRSTCMTCHVESDCLTCHNAIQKPLSVHPNDYISIHPIEARMDTPKCDSCHRYQSFCVACHDKAGVGLSAAAYFRAKNVRVHPDYQTWVVVIGPQHHGVQASRDIQECISCHRQEDCLPCHSSQAQSVDGIYKRYPVSKDPHPNGFQAICAGLYSRNPRPCLLCHPSGSPDLLSCGAH